MFIVCCEGGERKDKEKKFRQTLEVQVSETAGSNVYNLMCEVKVARGQNVVPW